MLDLDQTQKAPSMKSEHPSLDILIIALLACVLAMGMMAMFVKPAFEAAVGPIVSGLLNALSGACGARWGLTQVRSMLPPLPPDPPKA